MSANSRPQYDAASDRVLETARLWLEPITVGHAAQLFESLQDESLGFIERPVSIPELEERYRKWELRGPADGTEVWLNWAARNKKTMAYIGWLQATIRTDEDTNLSYVVFPPFWRQGYSTEACHEMISHLIEIYALDRFVVEMDVKNSASIAMAEKLGFRLCDRAEPNEYRYQLSARDWPQRVR